MKQTRAICLSCRLLSAGAGHRPSWPAISQSTRLEPGHVFSHGVPVAHFSSQSEETMNVIYPSPSPPSRRTSTPDRRPRKDPNQNRNPSLSLFQDVIAKDQKNEVRRTEDKVETEKYAELAAFRDKIASGAWDPATIIDETLNRLVPALRESTTGTARLLKGTLAPVFPQIVNHKCSNPDQLPSATNICVAHAETSTMMTDAATRLIISLIWRMLELGDSPQDIVLREALMTDMLGTWKVFCFSRRLLDVINSDSKLKSMEEDGKDGKVEKKAKEKKRGSGDDEDLAGLSVAHDWPPKEFYIPPRPFGRRRQTSTLTPKEVDAMLLALFPNVSMNFADLARVAAISTYVFLTDPAKTNPKVRIEARRFIEPVDSVVRTGLLDTKYIHKVFQKHKRLRDYILPRWSFITRLAPTTLSESARHVRDSDMKGMVYNLGQTLSKDAQPHQPLSKALAARDLPRAQAVWKTFRVFIEKQPTLEAQKKLVMQKTNDFDFFVHVFMALKCPEMSTEVWNYRLKLGIEPTIKSWTSMLHGGRQSRNEAAIEDIWRKIIRSKTQLDEHAWTTRISGLAACGNFRAALLALDEMIGLWRDRKGPGVPVEPTIIQVNAVMNAMAQKSMVKELTALLKWATDLGMSPDVFTYNTLLKISHRHKGVGTPEEILAAMERNGIEANEATVTIILEDIITAGVARTAKEYEEQVHEVLGKMEEANLRANMETYGKMVYLYLLKEKDNPGAGAQTAVDAILKYIEKRGLTLSTQICSMLTDHYFSQYPPNIEGVDVLVRSRRLLQHVTETSARTDRVFWEKVIRGYSEAGQAEDAMMAFDYLMVSFSETMVNDMPLSLSVAAKLLQTLLQNEDMEPAARLVRTMEKWGKSQPNQGRDDIMRFWKHQFWPTAQSYGLLQNWPQRQSEEDRDRRITAGGRL